MSPSDSPFFSCAMIFANGQMPHWPAGLGKVTDTTYVIAADGGARHCRVFGIKPHLIIGDLDSLPQKEQIEYKKQGVEIRRFSRDKDETDLELALKAAVEKNVEDIFIVGALGDRWDMTFANVFILTAPYLRNATVKLLDDRHLIFCLKGPEQIRLPGSINDQVSLLPLSPVVDGVSLKGLKYPLTNACLMMGSTQGISNVIVTDAADIEIKKGLLLVTIAHAL